MAKTIKEQAEALLTQHGWTYDRSRRSPAWTDSKKRTDNAIYLGTHGSIRYGLNKTDSRAFSYKSGEALNVLAAWLRKVTNMPEQLPIAKEENPLTVLRRQGHAVVQVMTLDQLTDFVQHWTNEEEETFEVYTWDNVPEGSNLYDNGCSTPCPSCKTSVVFSIGSLSHIHRVVTCPTCQHSFHPNPKKQRTYADAMRIQ